MALTECPHWGSKKDRIILVKVVGKGFLEEAELALDLQKWGGFERYRTSVAQKSF